MIRNKLLIIFLLLISTINIIPNKTYAKEDNITSIINNMTNEDKIAQMLMLSFQDDNDKGISKENIKEILYTYNYAGVILFNENTKDNEFFRLYNVIILILENNKLLNINDNRINESNIKLTSSLKEDKLYSDNIKEDKVTIPKILKIQRINIKD